METLKPTYLPLRGRAVLFATACLFTPVMAGEPAASGTPAAASVSIMEARELLAKGDEAYNAGRYHEAVEAYAGARDMIPDDAANGELRSATTVRYAQAAVEEGRAMVRVGDLPGAKALIDKVATATNDPAVLSYQAQLEDPIRTNPALTAEHGKNVDAVRRELYTAEGAYNLGKFDEAKAHYEKVLQIDPYNKAARRGMERIAVAKSDYYKSASDHTRADMLADVDKQWELTIQPSEEIPQLADPSTATGSGQFIAVSAKLDRIIIPRISMEQTSLEEAIEFLRVKTRENDTLETDPANKGVNFTINLGGATPEVAQKINSLRFDLRLSNVPVSQLLRYITQNTQTSFTTDEYSVIISPLNSSSEALITRTYKVSPDFLTSLSSGASAPSAPAADPFGETKPGEGLLAKKLSAQEALAGQGVNFPEGSSASYNPGNSTLLVTNTAVNHEQISQIVDSLTQTEPVAVAVRVTMIKAQESKLKELGFDWLLTNFGFGGPAWVPGANLLSISGGTQGNGSSLGDIVAPTGVTDTHPITSGNRSGDSAILGDSIDALIASNNQRNTQSDLRAPGILGLNGFLKDSVIQVMMRGLDQKKGVDLMSQPSVITRSGQAASIHIVREFIYPTEYEPPELPQNTANTTTVIVSGDGTIVGGGSANSQAVTPSTPTAFETRKVGTILEVLPVADANKRFVDVTIKPELTEFDGFVNYGTPITTGANSLAGPTTVTLTDNSILMPVFSVQRVSTSVTVTDGATIVIGGLLKEKMQNVEDKTPILGDIPVVGRLFQSKANSPEKTAIIFLVNVELLDATGRRFRDR